MPSSAESRNLAQGEFERARRHADLERLAGRIIGREFQLLPFDTIRRNLRQQSPLYRGLHEVPLERIIGSVGRYGEMTREFLPLNDALKDRWVKMAELAHSDQGWPPVDLYRVGNAYFVRDGNHRVSAARQLRFPTIEANVWEFPDDIEIGPKDRLDEVLNRFRERDFLDQTGLRTHPDYNIQFTTCGRYPELQAQIEEMRQKLEIIDERTVSFAEAAAAWYDLVYLPTVQVIRESGLLAAFPGRTEADLFAWMSLHRENLRHMYGEFDNLSELARLLMHHYREGLPARMTRRVRRLLGSEELPPLVGLDASAEEEE